MPPGPGGGQIRERGLAGQDGLALPPAAQILGHGQGTFIAAGRILLQALPHDGVQVGRQVRHQAPQGRQVGFHGAAEGLDAVVGGEGRLAGQHLVQGRAQAVDIRAAVDPLMLAAHLLGGHVVDGAHGLPMLGEFGGIQAPGQPEIQDRRFEAVLLAGHHDVGRLQIPMDQAHAVGGVDGFGHGFQHLDLLHAGEVLGGGFEGLPLDELHGDVALPLPFAHLVDAADVGVFDHGLMLGFHHEAGHQVGFVAPQELEGHHPFQARIVGLEHAAHAAFGYEAQVEVLLPGRQRERPQHLTAGAIRVRAGGGQAVPGAAAFQPRQARHGARRAVAFIDGGGAVGREVEGGRQGLVVQDVEQGGDFLRSQQAALGQAFDGIRIIGHRPDGRHIQQTMEKTQAKQTNLAVTVHAPAPPPVAPWGV